MTRLASLTAGAALALAAFSPAVAADTAMVRVLHAGPDAPAVDVYLDGAKVDALTNVPFGTISGYLSIPAGTHSIEVCANPDKTTCVIGPVDLTFAAGTKTTIAATNLVAGPIEAQVILDAPAANADKAQVRVVHFSHDTPTVDVLTQDGAAKVVEGLSYPDATGYLALDAGTYDLKVCASADNMVCPLDPGPLDLAAGTAYSVFAIGSLADTAAEGLTAVVAVDSITAPATDTVPSSNPFFAIALILAGIAALGAAARFAGVTIRR